VEFKRQGKGLTDNQAVLLGELMLRGEEVHVIDTRTAFLELLG